MSCADRDTWNARYREGAYAAREYPAAIVERVAPAVLARLRSTARVARPRALDVACGAGRTALWLARAGFAVDAVDIADVGLERARTLGAAQGLEVNWLAHDLDDGLPTDCAEYDLIVVVRYLNRPLLGALPARLRPGGTLVCEVHLATDQAVVGPTSAAFRVAPGELAALLPGLDIETLDEGIFDDPDGRPAALARLVGRLPAG